MHWPSTRHIGRLRPSEPANVQRTSRHSCSSVFVSVFVKNPTRIVALSLVMGLCLLVYRLAEQRLREQLAATG